MNVAKGRLPCDSRLAFACQPKYTLWPINTAAYLTGRKCTFFNRLPFGFLNAFHRGHEIQLSPPVATYSSGFLVRLFIGAGRNSCADRHNPLASRKIATELDRCCTGVPCGLAAAHFRSGIAVMPVEEKQHRVSQPAGTCPGNLGAMVSFCRRVNQAISSHQKRLGLLLWLRSASSVMGVVRPAYLLIVTLGIFQFNEP